VSSPHKDSRLDILALFKKCQTSPNKGKLPDIEVSGVRKVVEFLFLGKILILKQKWYFLRFAF
jgi:hypothetical protein